MAGPVNSEAEVASALYSYVCNQALSPLAAARLLAAGLAGPGGTGAVWYQEPPNVVIQHGVAAGRAVYGQQKQPLPQQFPQPPQQQQQAAGGASAGPAPSSGSRSSPRASQYKMDMVLWLDVGTDMGAGMGSSWLEPQKTPEAQAGTACAVSNQRQLGGDEPGAGGELQEQPSGSAGAAAGGGRGPQQRQAWGSSRVQGGPSSTGASGGLGDVDVDMEEPGPKRQRRHRCACVGEVKTIPKLMQDEDTPLDLRAAWKDEGAVHHKLARAVISQIYAYMGAHGVCYGFISCFLATWLVYCPPNNRDLLYLSQPFLATTAASSSNSGPGGGGSAAGAESSSAATAYGALALLQLLALQPPREDARPTGLRGPTALGSGGAGGSGDGGSGDGGSGAGGSGSGRDGVAGVDAGAGAGDNLPAPSGLAEGTPKSRQRVPGQELFRAAAALEPAGLEPAAPERTVAAAAAVAAQQPAPAPAAAARLPRPSRVLLHFGEELSPGSEGLVMAGTCDGVDCVIKLLGPDRSGLAAYDREVAAYAALEAVQGLHVPELLAWGDLDWGVRFLAVRRVAGSQPLSSLTYPIPAAVAAAAVRAMQAVQVACPGFVHGDVRLENMLVVASPAGEGGSGGGGDGDWSGGGGGGGGRGGGRAASSTPVRCVLLDFGRSRLDGDAQQQQLELEQLQAETAQQVKLV